MRASSTGQMMERLCALSNGRAPLPSSNQKQIIALTILSAHLSYYRQAAKRGHLQSQYFESPPAECHHKERIKWLEVIMKRLDDDGLIHFGKAFLASEYIKMDSTKETNTSSFIAPDTSQSLPLDQPLNSNCNH
ncbi:MAG: hypothetical protein IPP97_28440 [Candidatus Obscuribacter sp.]|nr:hypothetical protein [Candidatus Obscuribacter sp.]